jgi:hypothetical protein
MKRLVVRRSTSPRVFNGYSRASHLLDRLEEEGVIGPADRHNIREILQ